MDTKALFEILARRTSENAQIIGNFSAQAADQQRSSIDSIPLSKELFPTDVPDDVQRARASLLEALWELQQLCLGPSEFLEQHQVYNQQLSCLRWLLQFRILSHVPLTDDGVPFETVASSAKVPLTRLRNVARMAMTGGFLREPKPEHIAHSRISAQFMKQPQYLDWANFFTRYSAPTAQAFAEATERWGDTVAKNETAYNVAFDTELPFFEHIAASKEMTAAFAGYMRSLAKSEGTALKHVLTGFDWATLGEAHVVDVGGSTGHASILLLTYHPRLRCTVQDLPGTIAGASNVKLSLDTGVASRLTFAAHDFFTPQPAELAASADVFFLRRILHDWSDAGARTILQQLATAMTKPGARIIIMDTIMPLPGQLPPLHEAMLRVRDLTMAQNFNSYERELRDWVALFQSTSPKLKLRDYRQPPGSAMAVMDVVKADEDDGEAAV